MAGFTRRALGATGREVGPIGLGSSYGLSGREVERAFERGVDFLLWGSMRKSDFGRGVREVARKDRARATIAIQTYARAAWTMPGSVERALRALGTEYVDILCLAWWNGLPPARIVDRAMALRDSGKVRHLMVSCHARPTFAQFVDDGRYDALMLRYNAAHPGAEREVFPFVEAAGPRERRPGVVAFTATRWGTLLQPRFTPEGERTPTASDCYRFALSHPTVDVCLSGPSNAAELDEALAAVERGPLDDAEMAWMRRVGAHVRGATKLQPRGGVMSLLDRIATWSASCTTTAPRLPPAPG
jgi:aryl-alcohol dehydrogenase-like predicted oxidoreductase